VWDGKIARRELSEVPLLRVAVIGLVIVLFFLVIIFFLVIFWLLAEENVRNERPTWIYVIHVRMVLLLHFLHLNWVGLASSKK